MATQRNSAKEKGPTYHTKQQNSGTELTEREERVLPQGEFIERLYRTAEVAGTMVQEMHTAHSLLGLTVWNLCHSCVYVTTIASDDGRNKDSEHAALLFMTPHSKYEAAQLSLQRLDYGLHGPRFKFRQQQEMFLYSKAPEKFWGPPTLLFNDYRGTSTE